MPLFIPLYSRQEYPPAYPSVYHHRGRWPPPVPNLAHPRSPYSFVHVRHPPATRALSPSRHRARRDRQDHSGSRGPRRRYVRFTDQPVIIELAASPPQAQNPPSQSQSQATPARPTRGCLRRCTPRTPAAAPTASQPAATTPAAAAPSRQVSPAPARLLMNRLHRPRLAGAATTTTTTSTDVGLHALLASFPLRLWDLRRTTRPPYHPQHEPRLAEPAFPASKRKRSMTLQFRPCAGRADLGWSATVTAKAAGCATRLTVGDVLRAISAELFARSACGALRANKVQRASACEGGGEGEGEGEDEGEGEPLDACYAKARKAQRVRTRRGHTGRPHYDDALRNVDLYPVDHGKGLFFEGLSPERRGDGEVVYVVKLSCA